MEKIELLAEDDVLADFKLKELLDSEVCKVKWTQPQQAQKTYRPYNAALKCGLTGFYEKPPSGASLKSAIDYLCGVLKNLNCHCYSCLTPHHEVY